MAGRPDPAGHPRRPADPNSMPSPPTTTTTGHTAPCPTGPPPPPPTPHGPKPPPATAPATHGHDRVRTDRIDADGKLTLRHGGKLYHIGIGRAHARTRVLMLAHDLHIRIINAATGELLRELTLDPARDYQPTSRLPGPPPKTPRP